MAAISSATEIPNQDFQNNIADCSDNNNEELPRRKEKKFLMVMVNSANTYHIRRKAIRDSWWNFVFNDKESPLTKEKREMIDVKFVLGKKEGCDVTEEVEKYKDIVFVNIEDSYANLAEKTLEYMKLVDSKYDFEYFMHADDDSFVRLDLLFELLQTKPREKFYWGYIWNNGIRLTKPLRNPEAKSYMPVEQYPEDTPFPPFACGCGFILSRDLIHYLAVNRESFKFYRLVDVAFGIYLAPITDIVIENDDRVRPYRPLPLFKSDSIVQHYMKPEEFRGFYKKSIGKESHDQDQSVPESFYNMMASMGLMKK